MNLNGRAGVNADSRKQGLNAHEWGMQEIPAALFQVRGVSVEQDIYLRAAALDHFIDFLPREIHQTHS
jgi:hypothetical protein